MTGTAAFPSRFEYGVTNGTANGANCILTWRREIKLDASGVGDPTILTPRTRLLPTPYAIFAGKAGSVTSGGVTVDQLNSGGVPPVPGQFLSYDGG